MSLLDFVLISIILSFFAESMARQHSKLIYGTVIRNSIGMNFV